MYVQGRNKKTDDMKRKKKLPLPQDKLAAFGNEKKPQGTLVAETLNADEIAPSFLVSSRYLPAPWSFFCLLTICLHRRSISSLLLLF